MVTFHESYNYKGSINCFLTLEQNNDGTINVLSSYGEVISTINSVAELVMIVTDLSEDKYA
jgi:hypothetical protein